MSAIMGGLVQAIAGGAPRPIFLQTSSVTIGNTSSELSVIGSGVGSMTLPANFFKVGTTIKVRVFGIHTASGNPNLTPKVKLGGQTVLTVTFASQSSTNQVFYIEAFITCRSTGKNGTVFAQGDYDECGNADVGMPNTGTQTVDTTGPLTLDVTMQWGTGAPGNTLTATNVMIEAVG